jgi:hypothetical protein
MFGPQLHIKINENSRIDIWQEFNPGTFQVCIKMYNTQLIDDIIQDISVGSILIKDDNLKMIQDYFSNFRLNNKLTMMINSNRIHKNKTEEILQEFIIDQEFLHDHFQINIAIESDRNHCSVSLHGESLNNLMKYFINLKKR